MGAYFIQSEIWIGKSLVGVRPHLSGFLGLSCEVEEHLTVLSTQNGT